ncbi:MAG TPA: glycosyltransferase family A protein [Sphingomonas sp.]
MTETFLSVVMPVRNALPYLDAAVESILAQTHSNFEFVIRDDDSTDGSRERLRYWAGRDARIRLFEGEACLGPAGSSNWVVTQARADIVARMDADDVSHPRRLERELGVLLQRPDATLLGSVWEGIDRQGRVVREPDFSTVRSSGFAAPFAHGSIMFRRAAFEAVGGYRQECDFWEDLDLYIRMAGLGRVLVVAEPLYQHRFSETSTRLTSRRPRVEASVDLMFRCRAAHNRGEDYTPLLHAHRALPHDDRARLNPNTFLSLDFITLWSGLRPHTLNRILRHGRIGFDAVTIKALIWSAWATASPGTLRQVMRVMLRSRSAKARAALAGQSVFEWSVRGAPMSGAPDPAAVAIVTGRPA